MSNVNPSYPFSYPSLKIEHRHDNAVDLLAQHVSECLSLRALDQDIVILCIGTDRSTGDALGPLVGTKLKDQYMKTMHVYGTLEEPVHAVNLVEKIEMIQGNHRNPLIVAIDACLGQFSNVGSIHVADGPLKPGAGVKKELPPVGAFHITGIVNVGGFMEYFVLQNTRLFLVMRMAEVIATSLLYADSYLAKSEKRFNTLTLD
ncbi:MAG: spore protease YyaC [Clostridia bacterium]